MGSYSVSDVIRSANSLEYIIRTESHNFDTVTMELAKDLQPLIEDAKKGKITPPISEENIPGKHQLVEGLLNNNTRFSEEYSKFRMTLVSTTPELDKMILDKIRKIRDTNNKI